jgi:hypothetical protein
MLESITFTGRELLLAVLLASLVYLVEAWWLSRWGKRRARASMEARLRQLETEIGELKQRMQILEAKPPADSILDTRAATYADAQRMAREGAPALELAGSLGISRSEAELIVALQRAEGHSS